MDIYFCDSCRSHLPLRPSPLTMVRSRSLWALRPCLQAYKLHIAPPWPAQWQSLRWSSSIQQQEDAIAQLPDLNAQALEITASTTLKQCPPPEELIFGHNFTGKSFKTPPPFLYRSRNSQTPVANPTLPFYRPHAHRLMDRPERLAPSPNNTLPELLPRSSHLRLPLRQRMLRGHESLQEPCR